MESKIVPKVVQNRSEKRLRYKARCADGSKPIWSRFGIAFGSHFAAKIDIVSDLKSLHKKKPDLMHFRSGFWTYFERVLTPHRM